jgi:preprotein translocase subunit SecY
MAARVVPPAAEAQHGGRDPPDFRQSSIILFPATLAGMVQQPVNLMNWLKDIGAALSPGQPIYVMLYAAAIVFFCFFYTALVFNPRETADNLKKSGAFIPGYPSW